MALPGMEAGTLPKLFGASNDAKMASGRLAVDLKPARVVKAPRSDFFFNFLAQIL
jgi:hypothetical protein